MRPIACRLRRAGILTDRNYGKEGGVGQEGEERQERETANGGVGQYLGGAESGFLRRYVNCIVNL